MKWWNDLWLNEGFATYVENIGCSMVEPTWRMMDQFQVDVLQTAFAEDQSSYSHPISVDVEDPKDINSIFDSISYQKVRTKNNVENKAIFSLLPFVVLVISLKYICLLSLRKILHCPVFLGSVDYSNAEEFSWLT